MAEKKPPVIETAVIAWRDALRAIEVMPVVAGIAFVLYLVMSLAILAINANPYALVGSPWLPIIAIGASIVQAVLLAPLAIAVHRFVLLGEKTNRYPLEPKSSRYLRFVGFAILVKILWLIPTTIQSLIPADSGLAGVVGIPAFVLAITVVIIVVRRAILFPAIAIDAPGATWSKARGGVKIGALGASTSSPSWNLSAGRSRNVQVRPVVARLGRPRAAATVAYGRAIFSLRVIRYRLAPMGIDQQRTCSEL
jgi:hypothetical protein